MSAKLFCLGLFTTGILLASASQANASGYTFTDLGTLGNSSYANAINNVGQVVGSSNSHATTWNGTTATELGTLGEFSSVAYAINDAGQVAGYVSTMETVIYTDNLEYYFIFDIITSHATVWNGTTAINLDALGGDSSEAYAINNGGQVAGLINYGTHATVWNGTTATDLGTPGEYSSAAYAINNAGQVVGESNRPGYTDGFSHATAWNGTTATDLGTLPGGYVSFAYAINNGGQIVGESNLTGNAAWHATVWNGTTATDLGTLGGTNSKAYAINDAGQVVGSSDTTYTDTDIIHGVFSGFPYGSPFPAIPRATLWNGATATDLNSFLDASTVSAGWVLWEARGINNNGWIVGNAHNIATGENHAFLLALCPTCPTPTAPIPEPETYTMLLAGLGLMGFMTHRRKQKQAA